MPSLTNGLRYHFRVRATNADGNGPHAQTTIQLAASPAAAVTISDANLRAGLETALGKSAGATITRLEMAGLTSLNAQRSSISVLTGIESAVNLTTLRLRGNSISDLSALGTLTSLTWLSLSNNSISDISPLGALTSLRVLWLRENSITDVSALSSLTSLTTLYLNDNSITDVSALGALTSLTTLWAQRNSIADVSALGALTSLMTLQLDVNSIADVSALGTLASLRFLGLADNSIVDVTGLATLTSLIQLNLNWNSVADISALGGLTSLTVLSLWRNSISDISPLGPLTSLTSLSLSDNSISDVSALGSLTSLTSLSLSDNSISDVSALGSLTSLTRLRLSDNSISDVSALGTLTSLTELWLTDNSITDVSALGSLTSLTWLRLDDNSISDVSALGSLTSLTWLLLDDNSISDVSALGTLTSLTELWLTDNSISDISALGSLTSLRRLDLAENSIADVSALGSLTSLWSLGLYGNSISDVSSLADLERLSFVDLHGNAVSSVGALAEGDAFSTPGVGIVWSSRLSRAISLVDGPVLYLTANPLSTETVVSDIPALEARGVSVFFDRPGLTAAALADGRVTLRWTPADGAGYELRHGQDGTDLGDWTAIAESDAAAGSHTVEGLASGSTYVFELRRANDEAGLVGRVEVTLPAAPQAVAVVANRGLADGVAAALGKDAGAAFTRGELATISTLDLSRPDAPPTFGGAAPTMHDASAGTPISDLAGIELLVNLRRLNLDNNAVRDLAPLLALKHLEWLSVRGQALTSDSVYVHIPALRGRGVEVLFDAPVAAALSDAGLRLGVARALGKAPDSELTEGDLLSLAELDASALGVRSLDGLATAENLERLWLAGNRIDDVGELSRLASLTLLDVSDNRLSDVSAVSALTGLTTLMLGGNRLADVTPLARLTGLTALSLPDNGIEDVSPVAALTALEDLSLTGNRVADLSPLSRLTRLERLRLGGNQIEDISPLGGLASLARLWLNGNGVTSLAPLSRLASLSWLDASDNLVADAAPLAGLESLERVRLGGNRIVDLGPLASGSALGEGDALGVRRNPLSAASLDHVEALRGRGVAVLAGVALPHFPAASEAGREGFARVANLSGAAGEVLVTAVDAAGTRAGPARLNLDSGRVAHFNSADLEGGNAAKGLWPGVGPPGAPGVWRLELATTLAIEALAYVRTADGFVTSASGGLARAGEPESLRAGVFNPGRNRAQRSVLRVWNPGAVYEPFSVWGVDDAGSGRLATGYSVPAGGSVEVDAAALEAPRRVGWGLGPGIGKWRLSVNAPWPVQAMSLLQSAGSRVSDLSAAPSAGVDGVWRAPLFPAASAADADGAMREGFARVSNRSSWTGVARVTAVDDAGTRAGPVELTLPALTTVHFNSRDLRDGAPTKGLAAGVGSPAAGDWRLEIASELDLRVSAFARSADGFLTSLSEPAPVGADGAARVFFFNPGSNRNQQSLLRLVNDGAEATEVVVAGVDDAGAPGGEVRLTLAAGEARTLTAAQLESGGEGPEGVLGDGTGKWRLTVTSDAPVTVMSLLESATGHLTNLSAGGLD